MSRQNENKEGRPMSDGCFQLDEHVTIVPTIHASGACARAVEKWLIEHPCDCLAVPLPESFLVPVCEAVASLPIPSIVIQLEPRRFKNSAMDDFENESFAESLFDSDENEEEEEAVESEDRFTCNYVPIDPSQSVITAIRFAIGERVPVRFIDMETAEFQEQTSVLPDAFALREVSLEAFAAATLPTIGRPANEQVARRIAYMASQLVRLGKQFKHVVLICSIEHWPWLREAYLMEMNVERPLNTRELARMNDDVYAAENFCVAENTLIFMLGEIPFITGIYEHARNQLVDNPQEAAIDGVKRLLIAARASYIADLGHRARKITPLLLRQCLKYIRNLTLLDRRLTPDLYTIAIAAKQILGDQFAIHLVEACRNYQFYDYLPYPTVTMGVNQIRLSDGSTAASKSRLPGTPSEWRTIELNRKPLRDNKIKWQMRWNPYRQCSWPPEDDLIESFRTRVLERAKAIMGADLARSEKFSTSFMDGIDIRETLRHWFDGDLYVKIQPPSVGTLDACVMLFEASPDPRTYPWRTTWFAEHEEESTLAFFATNFADEMLGPGVAVATYGGALFLYPPRHIEDIWTDPDLDQYDTLEDRLVAAACIHCQSKHVALLSPNPPGALWRRMAKRYGKSLVHVPLSQFNDG